MCFEQPAVTSYIPRVYRILSSLLSTLGQSDLTSLPMDSDQTDNKIANWTDPFVVPFLKTMGHLQNKGVSNGLSEKGYFKIFELGMYVELVCR